MNKLSHILALSIAMLCLYVGLGAAGCNPAIAGPGGGGNANGTGGAGFFTGSCECPKPTVDATICNSDNHASQSYPGKTMQELLGVSVLYMSANGSFASPVDPVGISIADGIVEATSCPQGQTMFFVLPR